MLDVATKAMRWLGCSIGELPAAGSFGVKDLRLRGDHKDCITMHRNVVSPMR